jgi:hypothetical protein
VLFIPEVLKRVEGVEELYHFLRKDLRSEPNLRFPDLVWVKLYEKCPLAFL